MDLALTDEQESLRSSARAFLQRACPAEVVRRLRTPEGAGHDAGLWGEIVALGWPGLALPEAIGGGGGDLVDLAVVFEEAGRALAPTTLYSTVAAALLIDRAGDEAQRAALLTPVLEGQRLVSVALLEHGMRSSPDAIRTTAETVDDGVVVTGEKRYVANGGVADDLVVVARTGDGAGDIALVVVPTDGDGVSVDAMATFAHDAQHVVRLDGVRVPAERVLASPRGGWNPVARTVRDATALQCVEMVGGASRVLDMTIEYATQRVQFKRPIGSFQAVQHHVADLSTSIDAARLTAWQAVWRCATDDNADREVAIAKVAANAAYVDATLMAHQLHGGIGFALDHDLHLWSDRARATAQTFGTTDDHLRALGRRLAS